jgi:CRISPR-associated exonuclease Cas4
VAITPDLRRLVEETTKAIRAMLASGKLPPPVNDTRCRECSLKDICQPEAVGEKSRQARMAAKLYISDDAEVSP